MWQNVSFHRKVNSGETKLRFPHGFEFRLFEKFVKVNLFEQSKTVRYEKWGKTWFSTGKVNSGETKLKFPHRFEF